MSERQFGADDPDDDLTLLLLQRVWQGKLPTKISLAANESKSFTNTSPLYVSLLSLASLNIDPTPQDPLFTLLSPIYYQFLQN